jgi:hypothetical protein
MSDRLEILNKIESGEITPEEGARLLEELALKNIDSPEKEKSTLNILSKIESGEISSEEGIELLQSGTERDDKFTGEPGVSSSPSISDEEMKKWKQWWMYPMYVGVAIVVLAAMWMSSSYANHGYNFWFYCAWLPFLLGILLIGISSRSKAGPWVHVRVKSENQRVAVSIPIPIRLTAWGLKNFGHYIPHMENTALDEIILALEDTSKAGTPLYVQVDDGEDGERVEVFIG